jgi:predicted nucleic acid-binding protein
MEQVAKSEPLQLVEAPERKQPLVFLDTNVIFGYLKGDASAAQLFSAEAAGRIHFAVNAIVLQELLLGDAAGLPEFDRIIEHLHVLPSDLAKAEANAATRESHQRSLAAHERYSHRQQLG